MAFKFKDKNGENISMADATQMLENALDKSDTGEQSIKGIIKIEDANGNPVDVENDNQVITKKFVNDKFGAYTTVNINIPFNIDIDSEIKIVSNLYKDVLYCSKCGKRTSINGIQLPNNNEYTIYYKSDKTMTFVEKPLDLTTNQSKTVDVILEPILSLGSIELPEVGNADYAYQLKSFAINHEGYGKASVQGYSGGKNNNYYYAIFINSCDKLYVDKCKKVELFILGSGQDASNGTKGRGGKRLTIENIGGLDKADVSVVVGATSWVDSSVKINGFEYSSADGKYSDNEVGVYPFEDSSLSKSLYGASGSNTSTGYDTGGGYRSASLGGIGRLGGHFFGAGGGAQIDVGEYVDNSLYGSGFQGIVIMRWEV